QPLRPQETLNFAQSEHSKLWIGRLTAWSCRVESTSRENYPTGEAKQWYSQLSVLDESGKVRRTHQISVNNPLSYGGVDIYPSRWGLDAIAVAFNGHERELRLRPMGKRYASFLPLDESCLLILSVQDQKSGLRLFAKRPDWPSPRKLAEIAPGQIAQLGTVAI